jgi:steroid 5-alpha reductase family enzyme
MLGVWLRQRSTNSMTIVDVAWTVGCTVAPIMLLVFGPGDDMRRLLAAILVALWGGRLLWLLWPRLGEAEDSRYAGFRAQIGDQWNIWALKFCLFQGILIGFFSLSSAFISVSDTPLFASERGQILDGAAVVFFVVGWFFAWLADQQLHAHRSSDQSHLVCERGLWAWSRHPNYFGEWLSQIGLALLAWPLGWWWLIVPIGELLLIYFITGIPPAERQAVARRGDAYRDYQKRVSAFFPFPPQKTSTPLPTGEQP